LRETYFLTHQFRGRLPFGDDAVHIDGVHAPGRPKTDVLDCQWIQRLHSYGLLAAAFRPEDQVVVLRGYLRQRHMLIRDVGQHGGPLCGGVSGRTREIPYSDIGPRSPQ